MATTVTPTGLGLDWTTTTKSGLDGDTSSGGVVQPRAVRMLAQSGSCLSASDFGDCELACSLLAQDLSFRLRQLIQTAAIAARRQHQPCLSLTHLLLSSPAHVASGNRFQQPTRFFRVKGTDLFETEKFTVLLAGVAKSPLLVATSASQLHSSPPCCDNTLFVSEWTSLTADNIRKKSDEADDDNDDGGGGDDEQAYVSGVLDCLLVGSSKPHVLSWVLRDLATNGRVQRVAGRLLGLLGGLLKTCSQDARLCLAGLGTLSCLVWNPLVNLAASRVLQTASLDLCLAALTTSQLAVVVGDDDAEADSADWLLVREVAARTSADLVLRYAPVVGPDYQAVRLVERLLAFVEMTHGHNLAKCYGPLLCLSYFVTFDPSLANKVLLLVASKLVPLIDRHDSNSDSSQIEDGQSMAALAIRGAVAVVARRFLAALLSQVVADADEARSSYFEQSLAYWNLFEEVFSADVLLVVSCPAWPAVVTSSENTGSDGAPGRWWCKHCHQHLSSSSSSSPSSGEPRQRGTAWSNNKENNDDSTSKRSASDHRLTGHQSHRQQYNLHRRQQQQQQQSSSSADLSSSSSSTLTFKITGCSNLVPRRPLKPPGSVHHSPHLHQQHSQVAGGGGASSRWSKRSVAASTAASTMPRLPASLSRGHTLRLEQSHPGSAIAGQRNHHHHHHWCQASLYMFYVTL